jgi:hypothetical protein
VKRKEAGKQAQKRNKLDKYSCRSVLWTDSDLILGLDDHQNDPNDLDPYGGGFGLNIVKNNHIKLHQLYRIGFCSAYTLSAGKGGQQYQ